MKEKQYLIEENKKIINFERLGEIGTVNNRFLRASYSELEKLEGHLGQFSHVDEISLLIDKCFDYNTNTLVHK